MPTTQSLASIVTMQLTPYPLHLPPLAFPSVMTICCLLLSVYFFVVCLFCIYFLIFHMSGWYLFFLSSLVVENWRISLFLLMSSIPLYDISYLLHPFTGWWAFNCFHIVAIVSNAAMNREVHTSFQIAPFPFPENHHPSFSANVYWSLWCIKWPLCLILTTLLWRIHCYSTFTLQNMEAGRGRAYGHIARSGHAGIWTEVSTSRARSLTHCPATSTTTWWWSQSALSVAWKSDYWGQVTTFPPAEGTGSQLRYRSPGGFLPQKRKRKLPLGVKAWTLGTDILRSCRGSGDTKRNCLVLSSLNPPMTRMRSQSRPTMGQDDRETQTRTAGRQAPQSPNPSRPLLGVLGESGETVPSFLLLLNHASFPFS